MEKVEICEKQYRKDFHYFRAIAIVIIVLGHSVAGWPNKGLYGYISAFLQGSTGLFVFISGYFFQYLLKPNFDFLLYLKKKKNNILMPYLILTTCSFIYFVSVNKINENYIISFIKMLFYGKAYACYWYIPFATLLFLTAPFFVWIQKTKVRVKILILFVLLIIAIFIQRPEQTDNPLVILHSYFYFIPYYLMGMYYCEFIKAIEPKIYNAHCFFIFSFLSVLLIAINVNYWRNHEPVHNVIFVNDGLITYLSKISLIIASLIFTKWMAQEKHFLSEIIGTTSFTIYFLHLFFMQNLFKFFNPNTDNIIFDIISALFLSMNSIALSIITARLLKVIFKNKSRFIIGY